MNYLNAGKIADQYGFYDIADEYNVLMKLSQTEPSSNTIVFDKADTYLSFFNVYEEKDYAEYSYQELYEDIKSLLEELFKIKQRRFGESTTYLNLLDSTMPRNICDRLELPRDIKFNSKIHEINILNNLIKITNDEGNLYTGRGKEFDIKNFITKLVNSIMKDLRKILKFKKDYIDPMYDIITRVYDKQLAQCGLPIGESDYDKIKKTLIRDNSLVGAPIQQLLILNSMEQSENYQNNEQYRGWSNIIKVFGNKSIDWIVSQQVGDNRSSLISNFKKRKLEIIEDLGGEDADPSEVEKYLLEDLPNIVGAKQLHESGHPLPTNIKNIRSIDKLSTFLLQNANKNKKQLKEITSSWDKLPLEIRKEAFTKGYDYILDYIRVNIPIHEDAKDIAFSRESGKWGIEDKEQYKTLEDFYMMTQSIPIPSWAKISIDYKGYIGRFLPRNDPRGMYLGQHTNNCQHPEGAGSYCAFHGQGAETGAFFVIENKQKEIIAQSWAWEDDNGNIVFDNVETLYGDEAVDPRKDIISHIYNQISEKIPAHYVILGTGYNDMDLGDLKTSEYIPVTREKHEYSDARHNFVNENGGIIEENKENGNMLLHHNPEIPMTQSTKETFHTSPQYNMFKDNYIEEPFGIGIDHDEDEQDMRGF